MTTYKLENMREVNDNIPNKNNLVMEVIQLKSKNMREVNMEYMVDNLPTFSI